MQSLTHNELSADRNVVVLIQSLKSLLQSQACGFLEAIVQVYRPDGGEAIVQVYKPDGGFVMFQTVGPKPVVLYLNRVCPLPCNESRIPTCLHNDLERDSSGT
jgi:hypothetical protein